MASFFLRMAIHHYVSIGRLFTTNSRVVNKSHTQRKLATRPPVPADVESEAQCSYGGYRDAYVRRSWPTLEVPGAVAIEPDYEPGRAARKHGTGKGFCPLRWMRLIRSE